MKNPEALKPAVLQVLPALGDGGVERSTLEMAAYLQKQGWPNHVASAGGKLEYELSLLGVPHHRLPLATKNPLRILLNAHRLGELARQNDIAILHARSRAPAWSAWLALQGIVKYAKTPRFVATFHGTYGAKSQVKRLYNRVMLKGVVIANSQFIARHIVATYGYPIEKINISQRGVDFERLEAEQQQPASSTLPEWGQKRAAGGLNKSKDKIWSLICVGRLTRWKGQDALLDAMAEVKRLAPHLQWELAFVGGAGRGGYAAELRQKAADLELTPHIHWLGSRTDVLALNALADLAISPSLRPEAFGRAAVEAMAAGTPVIATKLGGSIETIIDGKTGWLVDVAESGEDVLTATHPKIRADVPQALAKSIIHALTDPARLASMGDNASRHVRQHFSSDRTCAAELEAYKKALGLTDPAPQKKSAKT